MTTKTYQGYRLVVGLRNTALSEKLQMDLTLTLDKAKKLIRQQEAVHEQQGILRDGNNTGGEHTLEHIQGNTKGNLRNILTRGSA